MEKNPVFTARRDEYRKLVENVKDSDTRRRATLTLELKLITEFGNGSEKFGAGLYLFPLWASLFWVSDCEDS